MISIALLALAAAPGAAGGAKRAPWDLKLASVSAPAPAALAPGAAFSLRWRVTRAGRRAKGARIEFLLSQDARADRRDLRLQRQRLAAVARRRTLSRSTRLTLPAAAAVRTYRVVVCVRQPKGKRDRRPRNDCRAARTPLRVGVAGPAGGVPGPAPAPSPDPAAPLPGLAFPRPANPLDVTPVLDGEASAKSAWITTEGGTLSTADANGTLYTLTIPPDALFSDAQITMRPVLALEGAPFSDGLVGAVRLEPEGLMLNKPAILEIEPLDGPPAPERWIGFTAEGDGEDLHRLPIAREGAVRLPIVHFSVPGVGNGGAADAQALGDRMPEGLQAQYEQTTSDLQAAADAHAHAASGYYRDIVRPALQAALTSDDAIADAMSRAFGFMRHHQLTGVDEDDTRLTTIYHEIYALMSEIMKNAIDRAFARCVNDHDLGAVRRMLSFARTAQLLGTDEGDNSVYGKINACARFEIDFESRVTTVLESGGYTHHLRASDLLIAGDQTNEGPLSWLEFSGGQESSGVCDYHYPDPPDEPDSIGHSKVTVVGTKDSLARAWLGFDLAPRVDGAPEPHPLAGAYLRLHTNSPIEITKLEHWGDCGSSTGTHEQSLWEVLFGIGAEGVVKLGAATVFTELEHGSGALLLRQSWATSLPGLSDTTTVDVWHRPTG